MNSAKQVDALVNQWKAEGKSSTYIVWNTALECVGWPYVFGAWGAECTVAERKKRYRDAHPTIKTACKAFDGGSCSGCKWYPGGERVRCFDCRGFTDWCLNRVGIDLKGEGATSQWNTSENWSAKGTIDSIPKSTLVCLFVQKGNKMEHTGFGMNNETVECSSGVQHFTQRKAKWTHWAIPKGIDGGIEPEPTPEPTPGWRPTIRRGDKGDVVREAQTMLLNLGYDIGKRTGIDGDFGRMTESAVQCFQGDHIGDYHLVVDGIVGPMTWDALDKESAKPKEPAKDDSVKTYTVKIVGLDLTQARLIASQYGSSASIIEGSDGA